MKAVIIKAVGKAELAEIEEQHMRPNYIKVKTVAVALNPSIQTRKPCSRVLLTMLADFQHTDGIGPVGGILGKYSHHAFQHPRPEPLRHRL